jgi:hypothetical protein
MQFIEAERARRQILGLRLKKLIEEALCLPIFRLTLFKSIDQGVDIIEASSRSTIPNFLEIIFAENLHLNQQRAFEVFCLKASSRNATMCKPLPKRQSLCIMMVEVYLCNCFLPSLYPSS